MICWIQKFRKLVDSMLEKFTKDLGIESDVFLTACGAASQRVHISIVKQLLAVESFLLFKKMMITRNKQLNEEAIKEMKDDGQADDFNEEEAAQEREKAELEQAIAESMAFEVIFKNQIFQNITLSVCIIGSQIILAIIKGCLYSCTRIAISYINCAAYNLTRRGKIVKSSIIITAENWLNTSKLGHE